METEEITKLVDSIYKNISDKFNPGARQMISAGKAYLKALHGAAAASRLYIEAVSKLGKNSQQALWGSSADVGTSLLQIVEVWNEIQNQQMNVLKAFYVDMIVPLETNLEKDTKVVQSEQKRFLQQHKILSESYSKAAANMKKQRKKHKSNSKASNTVSNKEIKTMQILEEEKSKLDAFCEQGLKNAMTQERRRYGFVLERLSSLAKHYLAYHSAGNTLYEKNIDEWMEVTKTRETLPESVEAICAKRLWQVNYWPDDEDDLTSVTSQLRKCKSMDASSLITDIGPRPLARARSDCNLSTPPQSPMSRSDSRGNSSWEAPVAKALYAYISSGDNQVNFLEGDMIALTGDRNKGWQYGENLRTQQSGWFPCAYIEPTLEETSPVNPSTHRRSASGKRPTTSPPPPPVTVTKFGDSLRYQQRRVGNSTLSIDRGSGSPPQTAPPLVPSLHSSNDSGFGNDPPVDYSDDDCNRNSSNTLKKPLGKQMSLQPDSDLLKDKGLVKRTKSSLWKFRKNDDVLEGMSLWRHRSLVDVTKDEKTFTYVKDINIDYDEDKESTLVNNDDESCIVVTDFKMRKGNEFSLRGNKKPDNENEMKRKSISSNIYEMEKPLVKREQVRRYYRDYTTDTEDTNVMKVNEDLRRKNRESFIEKDMYDMKLNVNLDKRGKKETPTSTKQNNEKKDKSATLQRETPDRKLVEDQKRISREIERLRNSGEYSKNNNNTLKQDERKSNGYKMMNGNTSNGIDRKSREYSVERGSYDKLNNYDDEHKERRNYTMEKESEVKQKWKENYVMMGYNDRNDVNKRYSLAGEDRNEVNKRYSLAQEDRNEVNKRYSMAGDSKIKPEYIEENRRYNNPISNKLNNRKIETESEDDWYDSWDEK
uniref:Brain-specific angiogenesis inhibitor 1-associated protein 2 n=1 Tax=Cacopsylla melanoneura TaxID=428564 RepID=A0A8D8Y597_9HEMI